MNNGKRSMEDIARDMLLELGVPAHLRVFST